MMECIAIVFCNDRSPPLIGGRNSVWFQHLLPVTLTMAVEPTGTGGGGACLPLHFFLIRVHITSNKD